MNRKLCVGEGRFFYCKISPAGERVTLAALREICQATHTAGIFIYRGAYVLA